MKNNIIVTIARQFGSGGREIGEKLAVKLDIPYYDKSLIPLRYCYIFICARDKRGTDEQREKKLIDIYLQL